MDDSSAALPAALATRFRVERRLRSAGVAGTFLVQDVRDARASVLHLLPFFPNPLATVRFVREMGMLIQLFSEPHPNVFPVLEVGESHGTPWYLTPNIEGEWLADHLARESRLPLDVGLRIVREVAHGLAYAHQRYVPHRDLSPRSILLADHRAVVTDFWVGHWARLEGPSASIVGPNATPASPYWSPEQVAGRPEDERTDLYALGCVAFVMLTGGLPAPVPAPRRRFPWRGKSPAMEAFRPDVPRALAAAIERAMAPDPTNRFPTVSAFLAALGPALAGA